MHIILGHAGCSGAGRRYRITMLPLFPAQDNVRDGLWRIGCVRVLSTQPCTHVECSAPCSAHTLCVIQAAGRLSEALRSASPRPVRDVDLVRDRPDEAVAGLARGVAAVAGGERWPGRGRVPDRVEQPPAVPQPLQDRLVRKVRLDLLLDCVLAARL